MADVLIQQGNQAVQAVQPQSFGFMDGSQYNISGTQIAPPTQTSNIPLNQVAPTQALTLPQVPLSNSSDPLAASVANTPKTLQDYIKQLTPEPTALDNTQNNIINRINELLPQSGGKEKALAQEQINQGIPDLQKQLQDLNNQILTGQAEYKQLVTDQQVKDAALETQPGMLTSIVTGQQNANARLFEAKKASKAAELGFIAAKAQAVSGNINTAIQLADRAIAAKYAPIEDELRIREAQLNSIQPLLDKEEKRVAQAQQLKIEDEKQAIAEKKQAQKENLNLAFQAGVATKFMNKNGEFSQTSDGTPYTNAADFLKAAGVKSFAEAYQKGLITDVNGATLADRDFVAQARAKYPDVSISSNATPEQVAQAIKGSRIYRKETYIAPPTGGGGGGGVYIPGANPVVDAWITNVKNGNATLTNVPANIRGLVSLGLAGGSSVIVDSGTDAQVKAIIAANPGEYGHAADAIDKAFGKGTASKYDAQLRAVYNDKQNVSQAFTNDPSYSPLAGSRFALEATRIAKNYIELPAYQLTANGLPYIQRIQAAIQTPGSVSDQELLDAMTKLSTSGNAVTDAQIKIITGGASYSDKISVLKNRLNKGGVLSSSQRNDLVKTANDIYSAYKRGYQPIYDQVTSQLQQSGVPQSFWTIPDLNALQAAGESGGQPQQMILNGQVLNLQPDGTYQ